MEMISLVEELKRLGFLKPEQGLEEKLKKNPKLEDFLTEGKTYVQRDLEDQIAEEYKSKGKNYEKTDKKSSNMSTQQTPRIVVQDVLNLLKKGYTRLEKDDMGHGSIQAHYNLTGVQVKELFSHPKLKMKKTILPKASLNIVDEEIEGIEEQEAAIRAGVEADNEVEEEIERTEGENSIPSEEEPQQDVVITSSEFITKRDQLFS